MKTMIAVLTMLFSICVQAASCKVGDQWYPYSDPKCQATTKPAKVEAVKQADDPAPEPVGEIKGSLNQRVTRIKAIMSVASEKAIRCETQLQIERQPDACIEFFEYLQGNRFQQAGIAFKELDWVKTVQRYPFESAEISTAAKTINSAKAFAEEFFRANKP